MRVRTKHGGNFSTCGYRFTPEWLSVELSEAQVAHVKACPVLEIEQKRQAYARPAPPPLPAAHEEEEKPKRRTRKKSKRSKK